MTELHTISAGSFTPAALRVLLFEDNAMDAALMRKFLQSAGVPAAHIFHTDSIPSALQVMTREDVHLCLADYHLPSHTGCDLMDEARRVELDVPFIVVTALDDRQVDEEARAHGAYAFLVKAELTVEGLERSIRYALTHHARKSKLIRSAYIDTLTRLPNRQSFLERLRRTVANHAASGGMVGVAIFNLAGTKAINETLGHRAGDDVLRMLARRLTAAKHAGDFIARLGGDEFGVVMTDFLLAPHALGRAQRLADAATGAVDTFAGSGAIVLTGGVASQASAAALSADDIADALLDQAALALRNARRDPRAGTESTLAFAHLH